MLDSTPVLLGEALANIAIQRPDHAAIVFSNRTYSYAQFDSLVQAFAIRMQEHGVDRDATVHISSGDTLIILASLFATARLGARFLQNVGNLEQGKIPFVTHSFNTPDRECVGIAIDAGWSPAEIREQGLELKAPAKPTETNVAFLIVYTSGTTAFPKFVELSQKVVYLRSFAVRSEFLPGKTVFASLFPNDSRPFFARAIAALLNGTTIVGEQKPEVWHELGVNRVSASLAQARRVFGGKVLDPKLPVVEVIGAKLEEQEVRILLKSFDLVDDTYGATETNKVYSNFSRLSESGAITANGHPNDTEVEIVTDDGVLCSQGEQGHVRLKNHYTVSTYLNTDRVGDMREGWYYPGDLACWGPNGVLQLEDRLSDVVNIGGSKVSFASLDRILMEVDGVSEVATFRKPGASVDNTILAFVLFEKSMNPLQLTAIAREKVRSVLGPDFVPNVFWPINRIPRKLDGSPDREKCADLIREGMGKAGGRPERAPT